MVGVRKRARRGVQLELPLPNTWGGRRTGAGRKPATPRRNVSHVVRPRHQRAHPVHVVLRSRVRSLRSQFMFPTLRRALAGATRARADFRIVHFSVQSDHLHLIVEADTRLALSRGMQGLAIRIAKRVNRLIFRRGTFWSDRFYARALTSPRTVKHAVRYVLNNFRKHGEVVRGSGDPCSSAEFASLLRRGVRSGKHEPIPISPARTWLARTCGASF